MKYIKKFENNENIDIELIKSIRDNDLDNVKYCIKNGANVNYYYKQYDTFPIMDVVGRSVESKELKNIKYEIMKLLLKSGANPDQKDSFNYTALIIAAEPEPYLNIIELLIKYNADWNLKDNHGNDFIDILNRSEYAYFVNVLAKKYPKKYDDYMIKKNTDKYNL